MRFETIDKAYNLVFTINALSDVEEMTGTPFTELVKGGQFSALRIIFYCGLLEENPKITLKDAGNILEGYLKAGNAVTDAFELVNKAIEAAGFIKAQASKPKKTKIG